LIEQEKRTEISVVALVWHSNVLNGLWSVEKGWTANPFLKALLRFRQKQRLAPKPIRLFYVNN
jgi:hypothetical protein